MTFSNYVYTASGLLLNCNYTINSCNNVINSCNKSISDVENSKIACITITSACSVATASCAAATLLCTPGPTGVPGVPGIQGVKGDTGSKGDHGDKGDKGDHGDSYFTQNANNIITQNSLIIQDNYNDNIVNLSNSLSSQSDFYNNVEFHKDVTIDSYNINTNLNNSLIPLIGNNVFLGAVGAATYSVINGATINIRSSLSNLFINGNLFLNGGLIYRASSGYSNAVSMVEYISQI